MHNLNATVLFFTQVAIIFGCTRAVQDISYSYLPLFLTDSLDFQKVRFEFTFPKMITYKNLTNFNKLTGQPHNQPNKKKNTQPTKETINHHNALIDRPNKDAKSTVHRSIETMKLKTQIAVHASLSVSFSHPLSLFPKISLFYETTLEDSFGVTLKEFTV